MDLGLLAGLRDRDLSREGVCIGEGRFVVERMLQQGLEPLALASVPGMAGGLQDLSPYPLPLSVMPQGEIGRIAGFPFHRGVLGAFRAPVPADPAELDLGAGDTVLVLDGITDPVNLGGILRSAAAFDVRAVLIGPRCGNPFSRRGIRASMAACFSIPLADAADAASAVRILKKSGLRLLGAELSDESRPVGECSKEGGLALVLGNEGHGISEQWRSACDGFVMIPVSSRVDSLNVGVAAGILLYQLAGVSGLMV
jgi:tRNA G18 (ribose-2'-O)-methylase SpoU